MLKIIKGILPQKTQIETQKTQTEVFVSKRQIDNFGALFVKNKD